MAGIFNLDGLWRSFLPPEFADSGQHRIIAVVKTAISAALAILLAWIVARTDTPARGTLEILITLPFFIPPVVTGMAWALLGTPRVGALNLLCSR